MVRATSFLLVVFVVLSLAALFASCEERSFVELDESLSLPAGWRRLSTNAVVQSERTVKLLIALKRRNLDLLEQTFWSVSNPKSTQYGKHLSLDQIADLIAPEQSVIEDVTSWLVSNGAQDIVIHQSKDYISAIASVEVASRMFNVRFHSYKHSSGLIFDASLGPYSLPSNIATHVELVSGLVGFPDIEQRPKVHQRPTDVNNRVDAAKAPITPSVIRTRYNVTDNVVNPNPKNARAVAEFQAQYFSPQDLQDFYKKFIPDATYTAITNIIGTNDPSNPGLEASLDIQYIIGVVPNITTWFYSMASYNFWNDLLRWTAEIQNEGQPPLVHSVSYGEQGNYPSITYRDRLNGDFQVLGTRGISIIFASGDDGAGCGNGDAGAEYAPAACDCSFFPSFPATSPYVTSVGATAFINGNTGPEMAVKLFKSGGGFSYIFDTTSEQSADVEAYFNSGVKLPEACAYNASGRGTPDVSALGDEAFQVYQGGSITAVGGTSASAPTFASIISLLNEQRLNAGKSGLGFLNPWVYQSAQTKGAFYDVTQGDNLTPRCCRSGALGGFECAQGWDPVTGVGTPNYAVLKTLI